MPERARINHVVKVIVRFLEANGVRGFWDYKTIKCGDDIAEEVREHCRQALAFVQLIEDGIIY